MACSLLPAAPMKLLSSAIIAGGLILGSSAFAQDPGQSTPPQGKQENDAPKVSVTGCLTKGGGTNEYLVTDTKSGEKLPFGGPSQLDKYVNQTVTLMGSMASQGSNKVFKPEAIKQVSPTCDKAQ